MSAWAEAVWIIKKLQKNFDFEKDIKIYTQNLNDLNKRVNQLNTTVASTTEQLMSRNTTIRATKTTDSRGNIIPNTSEPYSEGTIWIVIN